MKVSESNRPEYADGFVVLDVQQAPTLRNAVGSRIFRRRATADTWRERARVTDKHNAAHYHVVPVEGPNEHYALGYVDATGVTIGANGYLSFAAWEPKGGRRWG